MAQFERLFNELLKNITITPTQAVKQGEIFGYLRQMIRRTVQADTFLMELGRNKVDLVMTFFRIRPHTYVKVETT